MTDFNRELYPFLFSQDAAPAPEAVAAALAEVSASTLQKSRDVIELRRALHAEYREPLVTAAVQMADAFRAGGKLLAMGNGGSATDAQDAAADCLNPPVPGWRALPALALVNDVGVVTAVANDVGYENVFARQVIAFGEPGDIALGFTTSGNSPNIQAAFAAAKRRALLTIAFTGYDGGALARDANTDIAFVARLEHIPRIQEGHATLWHTLLELVHALFGDPIQETA